MVRLAGESNCESDCECKWSVSVTDWGAVQGGLHSVAAGMGPSPPVVLNWISRKKLIHGTVFFLTIPV